MDDQYEEELLARAVSRLDAALSTSHRLILALADRVCAQSEVITNLIQRRPAMTGTDLYRICPRCRGRGVIDTDDGTAACLSCTTRHVVLAQVSEEGVGELRRQCDRYRRALVVAADGCKRREEQYGIPAARTCWRCGLGPCELGEARDSQTPLKT